MFVVYYKSNVMWCNKDITKYHEDLYFVSGMLKLKYNVGLDKFATNFCTHTHFINKTFCLS